MIRESTGLAGRTALVTGAGKRIGRAVSLSLARCGVHVVVHYNLSETPADQVAQECRDAGVKAWTVQADLARPQEVDTLFWRAREAAGPIDILINNASIFPKETFEEMTAGSIVHNQQVNAIAPYVLMRDFAAQGVLGDIVNLLDTRIVDVDLQHAAYHLSKRALFTLTKIAAMELAPQVKVNGVAPGLILPPPGQDESYLVKLAHTNPLQRVGCAEDIAEAMLFLLGAKFITGQVIFVDGGRHLKGAFYGGG